MADLDTALGGLASGGIAGLDRPGNGNGNGRVSRRTTARRPVGAPGGGGDVLVARPDADGRSRPRTRRGPSSTPSSTTRARTTPWTPLRSPRCARPDPPAAAACRCRGRHRDVPGDVQDAGGGAGHRRRLHRAGRRAALPTPCRGRRRDAVGLVLVGAGGTLLIRRSLAPLDRVAATARRVSGLKLDSGQVALAERVAPVDADERHRGRPGRSRAQHDARQRRVSAPRPAGERDPGPPVRRRRQPRAAHPAGLDPRLCRADPARERARARRRSRTPSAASSPRRSGCRSSSRTCCSSRASTPAAPSSASRSTCRCSPSTP